MNTYEIERFHHFDGVHHADGLFNVGDIVDVEEPLTGIDKNGNVYHVDASGWFTKNVVQLMTTIDDSGHVTINDGTSNSPIVVTNATPDSFSPASWLNRLAFKPYVVTTTVVGQVIDTGSKVVTSVVDTAGNVVSETTDLVSGISKNLKWIFIAALVLGAIYAASKFKLI